MCTTGADHISMNWYKCRLQSYLCWVNLHSGKLIHIYITIRGKNNLFFYLQLQPESENISSETLALKGYIHSLHRQRGKTCHLYLYQHVGLSEVAVMDPSTDEPLHLHWGFAQKSPRLHLTKGQDGPSQKAGTGSWGIITYPRDWRAKRWIDIYVHGKSAEIQGVSLVGTLAQTKLLKSSQKCGIKGRVWDGSGLRKCCLLHQLYWEIPQQFFMAPSA